MEQLKTKKLKFDYSWVIIAVCFLVVGVSLGFCSSGRTMYLNAITDALGFGRGAFSLNDTFRFASTTIINIFFGTLVNKFGIKKLVCAGFMCLISFALINSYADQLWQFYIGGILLGIGLAWTSTTMVGAVINIWCKEENRGKFTGLILSANGLFGAIAVQIISPIIYQEGNAFGYRDSYRLVAIILAVVLALVVIFLKDRPKGAEKTIIKKKVKKARGRGWVGMEYKSIVKKPYFYLACACIALTGMTLQGLGGIATPHLYDVGLSKPLVANITSISSLVMMFTKIFIGFMYDKKGIRITMNICFICSFISQISLVAVTNTPLGIGLAYGRVVFAAIALPLETVMLPLYASELFGNKSYMSVLGVFTAVNYAGYAFGAPFGNMIFDITGSYNIAFIIFGALMLFIAVSMQFVVKASRKDRALIEQEENIEATCEKKKPSLFARINWKKEVRPVIGFSLFFATISLALIIGILVFCL